MITSNLGHAWAQQRVWSETANCLKHRIETARRAALALGIAAAVLAVAAVQLAGVSSAAGRTLGLLAGVSAGLASALQRRAGTRQVAAWTRASPLPRDSSPKCTSTSSTATERCGCGRTVRDAWVRFACTQAGRNLTHPEWNQHLPGRRYQRTCPDLPSG